MGNNNTTTPVPRILKENYHVHWKVSNTLSFFDGVLGIMSNVIVLIAIYRVKRKTKNLILVAAFALGCLSLSAGEFYASVWRFTVLMDLGARMTPMECLCRGMHITLLAIGNNTCNFSLVLISVDRFLAVISWNFYRKFSKRVISLMLLTVSSVSIFDVFTIWLTTSLKPEHLISAMCLYSQVVPREEFLMHGYFSLLCDYVSILVYAAAVIATRFINSRSEQIRRLQLKREIAVTKRVAILCVTTFLLQALPMTVLFSFQLDTPSFIMLTFYIWHFTSIDAISETLLYSWYHPDLRKSMIDMATKFRHFLVKLKTGAAVQPSCFDSNHQQRNNMTIVTKGPAIFNRNTLSREMSAY